MVGYDASDPVFVELAFVYQSLAFIYWEEFSGFEGVVFFFYDVCYSFHCTYILPYLYFFVKGFTEVGGSLA